MYVIIYNTHYSFPLAHSILTICSCYQSPYLQPSRTSHKPWHAGQWALALKLCSKAAAPGQATPSITLAFFCIHKWTFISLRCCRFGFS